MMLVASQSQLS